MAVWGNYSQGIMEYDTTSASNITTQTTQLSQSARYQHYKNILHFIVTKIGKTE